MLGTILLYSNLLINFINVFDILKFSDYTKCMKLRSSHI
jgi:hypothetical protein